MKGFVSVTSFAGALSLLAALPSMAQNAAASETLEEVVVTAEFRTVDIQKTAINLTVVTQEDLINRGVTDTRTLLDSVPGLDITNANPNNYIGLYGTASGGGHMWSDGSMSFNYAGVPLARQTAQAAAMYDLERVEVLKGPQGTLYGRNATTGALNIVTARPTAEYGGNASITAGNYGTINSQGHLNMPVSDKVWARFAFQNTRHDGYLSNGYDDANNFGLRGSLLIKPNDNVNLLVMADTFRNRSKGPTTVVRYYLNQTQEWIDPSNPWFGLGPVGTCSNALLCPSFALPAAGGVNAQAPVVAGATGPVANGAGVGDGFVDTSPNGEANYSVYGADAFSRSGQDMYSAQLDWKLAPGTVTVLAARVNTTIDYTSYTNGLRFGNFSDVYQNSLEVRYANNGDGKLKYLFGAFLYREHQNAFQFNMQNSGYALLSTPNLTDDNYAAFGDLTYSITDAFRVSVGGRYTNEQKKQDGYVTLNGVGQNLFATYAPFGIQCFNSNIAAKVNFAGYPQPSNFCVLPNGGKFTNSNSSGKLGFEWDFRDGAMAYFTVKQGFRSGGLTAGSETTYKPEKLLAYELGLRSRFLDQRLQLNASAFKWKYDDQQFSILHPFSVAGTFPAGVQTSYPFNANGELHGVEIDLQARVFERDRTGLNVLYTKGKLDNVPTIINSANQVTASLIDADRPNLPTWTFNGSYEHRVALSNGGSFSMRAEAHHESSAWMRLVAEVNKRPGDFRNAFTKLNLSLSYEPSDGKWSIGAYCNNATNEAVPGVGSSGQVANLTFFKSPGNPADARGATLDPPRTYGLRVNASF